MIAKIAYERLKEIVNKMIPKEDDSFDQTFSELDRYFKGEEVNDVESTLKTLQDKFIDMPQKDLEQYRSVMGFFQMIWYYITGNQLSRTNYNKMVHARRHSEVAIIRKELGKLSNNPRRSD